MSTCPSFRGLRLHVGLLLATLLAGTAAAAVAAKSADPAVDEAFIRQFASTYGFRLGRPGHVAIAPDGDVLFTRTPPRSFVADLFERDAKSGEVRKILDTETLLAGAQEEISAEEKARRERIRQATRGISDFALSQDGKRLLVPLSDRLFVVERATGTITALATGEGFPYDPHLSRAGDRVAFVVDKDLWVIDVKPGAAPRRLTTRPDATIENGVAEFVAQEEMDRTRGFWWSPDGSQIAYQRNDVSKVEVSWVADPAHPEREPTPFRYPRPGQPNADVTLGVLDVASGSTRWVKWDRARWPYLTRVTWPPRGPLTLVVMNRAQTELGVVAADESGTTRILLTETDPAWLDLPEPSLPRWLADGSGFLWASERSGGWTLELRHADGTLDRTLTPPELGIAVFAGFDDSSRSAFVLAGKDPAQSQVWRVPLTGRPVLVTNEDVVSGVGVGRSGWFVTTTSPRSGGRRVEVHRPDGTIAGELPSVAESPPWTPNVEWTTADSGGRSFRAAIVRPRTFDRARKYPVLVHVYAGPTSQMVVAVPDAYLLEQWYADAGFVVVAIDGRGTPNRGRDWERAVHKDLISVALTDQAAALQALGARYPELDLGRVGIYGWSFGGYASAMAVILRPDVYRAAVAGAPVTDWKLYDTFYTERYMQTPEENPEGYARSSAIVHAAELTRPLLVVHGTSDDNVHFANSLGLVQALFRAGKTVELLPVGATHMTPDPEVALALHERTLAFFREHL
jgi:dipeptidyl-peptidase-4